MEIKNNTAVESVRRGFTLVEMLVVIALIGMLATLAMKSLVPAFQGSSVTVAEAGCHSLVESCQMYQMKHKKLPSNLDQLTEGDDPVLDSDKPLYDPWDNKYEMEIKNKVRVIIKSAGPDREWNTDDDIRSDSKKKVTK